MKLRAPALGGVSPTLDLGKMGCHSRFFKDGFVCKS